MPRLTPEKDEQLRNPFARSHQDGNTPDSPKSPAFTRGKVATATVAAAALAATLFAAPATAAPTATSAASSTHQAASTSKYSDDDFLLAVLFGTGPLAEALGTYLADEVPLPENYDQLASKLLEDFRGEFPEVVESATEAFRSGNPLEVQEAITSVQASFQSRYLDKAPEVRNGTLCATVNLVLAGNLAVFLNVGIAVFVGVIAYVAIDQANSASSIELTSARLADLGAE
ncbi:hypothetical protein [Microbacterium sp. 2RAF4]|uniref:hypothetical protein n=1 Tax=Microbacterium sp. 2RAF4 TaxID=3232999 RepID=UPI003F9692C9